MRQRKLLRQVNQALRQTRRLRQMQVALYQSKCRLGDAVRRSRTRHIIEQGGLVVMVDLLNVDRDVLSGALLRAAQHLHDLKMVEKWRIIGRRRFAEWRQTGRDATLPAIPKTQQTDDPGKDRKRMTRQLCELGGLIDKAGFAEVDRAVLLGILSEIARCRNNASALASWKQTTIEDAAAKTAAQARIQLVRVIFPGRIPRPIGRQLRQLGLRYRKKLRLWEGDADPDVAARVSGPAGGEVFVKVKRPA